MKNTDNMKFAIDFLKDEKGIYGIGHFDKKGRATKQLILRPDMLHLSDAKCAALQMIPKGHCTRYFEHTIEDLYIEKIWAGILRRKGLKSYNNWICSNKKRSVEECRKYHGSKQAARLIINRLIHGALEEAAEPVALKLARRFAPNFRYDIYAATAQSVRARQLAEVFPVLALCIFKDRLERKDDGLIRGAHRLIESGAKLRDIATLMGIPMSYRHVKPGAAHLALRALDAVNDPRLLDAYRRRKMTAPTRPRHELEKHSSPNPTR